MEKINNSLNDLMRDFIILLDSSTEVLKGLTESVNSSSNNINIQLTNLDGTSTNYTIPSFKYLDNELNKIKTTLSQLTGMGTSTNVRMPDGTWSKIFTTKLLNAPEKITGINVPNQFSWKSNWVFDKLMSPLLFFKMDLSDFINYECDKIQVKRLILNINNNNDIQYFNNEFKGRNDIEYSEAIVKLENNNINFFIDESTKELPVGILRYEGTFDILRYEDTTVLIGNSEVKKRKYFLNKLTYTDNTSGSADSMELTVGTKLIIGDNTTFSVEAVDTDDNSIILKKISGTKVPQTGIDQLRIHSEKFEPKVAHITIGFDERQIVFIKPVNKENHVTSTEWSTGIAFWSNELVTQTNDGELNLETYYRDIVIDLGQEFLSKSKEKFIPVIYAEEPNTPSLSGANLEVVRINNHKLNDKDAEEVKKKAADKSRLQSEIREIEISIDKKREELINTNFSTEAERRGVRNELNSLISEKSAKSSLYYSIVQELVAISEDVPSTLSEPKYRIRGFFPIPSPKWNIKTGNQYPIQFIIEWRYLSLDGSSSTNKEYTFTNTEGQQQKGSYSNWNRMKSDIRSRIYDDQTESFEWASEDLENPDVNNINQIDIPISKGEKVEIRVKSISEAGYPSNLITSPFSETVVVEFPEQLVENNQVTNSLIQANEEFTRVAFQQELSSRGLDQHLSTAFNTGEKYIAHDAQMIASGFFTNEGNIIDMFEMIKTLRNEIDTLKARLDDIRGELRVSIFDTDGNRIIIKNGDTVKLFAGYYIDNINTLPSDDRKGAIISNVYRLVIDNTESTALELISRLPGGIDEILPDTRSLSGSNLDDYEASRKYDMVPIVHNSIDESETTIRSRVAQSLYQSQQFMSQWIYSRFTDVGLRAESGKLYEDPVDTDRNLLPDLDSGQTDSTIWDGSNTTSESGYLNNFCIHKDHPLAQLGQTYNELQWSEDIEGLPKQNPFKHSLAFNRKVKGSGGTAEYHRQLSYKNNFPETWDPENLNQSHLYIPSKFGFNENDRYLVGKNTCGSYLYLAPVNIDQLLVDGTDYRAKRTLKSGENNGIEIPIVFQYRMLDYYGEDGIVGGYDLDTATQIEANNTQTNLTYSKKIGLDIYVKDESVFSFDIQVTSKYQRESLAQKIENTSSSIGISREVLKVSKKDIKSIR